MRQPLGAGLEEPVGAVHSHRDQARFAKDLQVFRHTGRGKAEALGQFSGATLAAPGLDEDVPTVAAGDGSHQLVKTLRLNHETRVLRKNPK